MPRTAHAFGNWVRGCPPTPPPVGQIKGHEKAYGQKDFKNRTGKDALEGKNQSGSAKKISSIGKTQKVKRDCADAGGVSASSDARSSRREDRNGSTNQTKGGNPARVSAQKENSTLTHEMKRAISG